MPERTALVRLEIWLYGVSTLVFLATIVELILLEHDQEALQLVPFALCGLGLASVALLRYWRNWVAKVVAVVVAASIALGSAVGVWKHIEGNLGFFNETHKHGSLRDKLDAALTGQAPPLAPGMLVVGAVLLLMAMYAGRSLAASAQPKTPTS